MGIRFLSCIYHDEQAQLHSSGIQFVQFWGPAGGHLCFVHKPYISPQWKLAYGVEGRAQQGDWKGKVPIDAICRCSICRQSRQRFASGSGKRKRSLVPLHVLQNVI